MFLNLGIGIMRKWEADNDIPATFLRAHGRISEFAIILDSQGHRYLVYLTSRKPTFLPWTLVACKQYGTPWQSQQQVQFKVLPFRLRPMLERAHRIILDWISECDATQLSSDEAAAEANRFYDEMGKEKTAKSIDCTSQ